MSTFDDKKRSQPTFDTGTYWGVQKYAYDGTDIEYIGRNKAQDAATSLDDWFIWKYTIAADLVTDIELLQGAWDDRATLNWR